MFKLELASSAKELVEIKNLYFKYSKKDKYYNLEDVSFSILPNRFHIFIGENGAGKSTTIKLLIGSLNQYDGHIIINGLDTKQNYKARSNVSYIPDKAIFPLGMTVIKYLRLMGSLTYDDKNELDKEIAKLLKKYDIESLVDKKANNLSAGQKKKVLLIRAIIEKSKLIILDEPAANLDRTTTISLLKDLKELSESGTTVFISTHLLDVVQDYANYGTFIKKGKILYTGPVDRSNIIERYNNIYLRGEYD